MINKIIHQFYYNKSIILVILLNILLLVHSVLPNVTEERKEKRWTLSKMRKFLNLFAKKRNMDPSQANTWIDLHKEFTQQKVNIKKYLNISFKLNISFSNIIQKNLKF